MSAETVVPPRPWSVTGGLVEYKGELHLMFSWAICENGEVTTTLAPIGEKVVVPITPGHTIRMLWVNEDGDIVMDTDENAVLHTADRLRIDQIIRPADAP